MTFVDLIIHCLFVHSFNYAFIMHSLIRSFTCLHVHLFNRLLMHSLMHLFMNSLIHCIVNRTLSVKMVMMG